VCNCGAHGNMAYEVIRAQQGGMYGGGVHGNMVHVVIRAQQGGVCGGGVQ
jgi:hypothetical protein